MKTRLPKALLLSVLAAFATSGVAQATTVQIKDVVSDIDALKAGLTASAERVYTYVESEKSEEPIKKLLYTKPVVWETEATEITDANTLSGYTADVTTPLYVREGTLKIENSKLTDKMPAVSQVHLAVSGKNASLEISNSEFIDKSNSGFIQVGGPDGAGTLTISNNSTVLVYYSLSAGHHKNAQWNSSQYCINNTTATATTDGRYASGDYDKITLPDGSTREYGKGTINVTSGSTLQVGTGIYLAESDMNIDDAKVINYRSVTGSQTFDITGTPGNTDYWNRLGRQTGSTTNLNLTNGGVWEITAGHLTSGVQDLNGTTVNILVDGKGSELKLTGDYGTIALGIGTHTQDSSLRASSKDNKNETNLTISESGLVSAKTILLGVQEDKGCVGNDTVNVKITGSESTMSANEIALGKGASVVSEGIISGCVSLSSGASLTLLDGADTGSLTATGGTLAVLGDVEFNGNIMLSETGFLFTDGAIIDLNGNDFAFEGGAITIVVNAATPAVAMFSLADEEMLDSYGITFKNAGTVTGFDEEIEVTIAMMDAEGQITNTGETYILKSSDVKVQSIPEPTTATLSLLALAGLCARRRRK